MAYETDLVVLLSERFRLVVILKGKPDESRTGQNGSADKHDKKRSSIRSDAAYTGEISS